MKSIMGERRGGGMGERAARAVCALCALFSVAAVVSVAFYIIAGGIPAAQKAGLKEILLGTVWKPAAAEPQYGILYMILTSLAGTFLAVLIGAPAGILTAVFLAEISGDGAARAVRASVELLAGIPSVIYGLLGVRLLNPVMYKLELLCFKESSKHQFTGGANLLSASLVLAVMILPTVINISEAAIRRVPGEIRAAAAALGASRIQTVFGAVLPAAGPGIIAAVILALGRALGEATAIMLVAGNSVNIPLPFHSVRFLTTTIVSEMGYSQGFHRQMLFTVGLVLFVLIMLVNGLIGRRLREGVQK